MSTTKLVVSASTHQMIAAHSRAGFVYPVQKTSSGGFVIELDDDVMDRLADFDPDPETAIRIICSGQLGRA